jgi:glyoxylase-like metal-dependent hydrolase (beta-lactamase superfamily II)
MFEIYALNICDATEDSSITFYQAQPGTKIKKAYYFFCLKNKQQAILLDTGISSAALELRGLTAQTTRERLLQEIGVSPEKVEAVILSHIHDDHFAQSEIYSNAIFYIQRSEYQFWNEDIQRFHDILYPPFTKGKPVADFEALRKLNAEKRLRLLDGDSEIYPGIRSIWLGAHTPGSQGIAIRTEAEEILYCGDFICNYRNLYEQIPVGVLTNLVEWLKGLGKIERMHLKKKSILPGHDPEILTIFPKVGSNIVRIA